MKRCWLSVLALCISLCLMSSVSAQQASSPSKEESVNHLLDLAHTEQFTGLFFDVLMTAYIEMMPKLDGNSATTFDAAEPELRAELIKLVNETTTRVAELTKERVMADGTLKSVKKEIAVKIWSDNFTEDELNQLIGFLRTPVGQKFINIGPITASETSR